LEGIFAFLLKHETLDFVTDLLVGAELLGLLILQAYDVKAF